MHINNFLTSKDYLFVVYFNMIKTEHVMFSNISTIGNDSEYALEANGINLVHDDLKI